MTPLLSICIPTKNRYKTLFPVIESFIAYIEGSNYEIIIQDNSDDNKEVLMQIEKIGSSLIKYFYKSGSISVSENTHLAISNAKGCYVTLIGDDDLVSPYILDVVQEMDKKGIESLIYNKGNYYWKDVDIIKKYAFNHRDSLTIPKNISKNYQRVDIEKELDNLLYNAVGRDNGCPQLYHGVVKKTSLERIYQKYGTFVPGPSPDMTLGIALALTINNCFYINYPVTITGASKKSAAGMGTKGKHIGKIEEIPWLPKDLIENWDVRIPRIWTAATIYAQSMYEVLLKGNSHKVVNYDSLYRHMYINYPSQIKKLVIPFLFEGKNRKYILILNIKRFVKKIIFRSPAILLNFLIFLRGDFRIKKEYKKIGGIEKAMVFLRKNTKLKDEVFK